MFTLEDVKRINVRLESNHRSCPCCLMPVVARLIGEAAVGVMVYCSQLCGFTLLLLKGGKFDNPRPSGNRTVVSQGQTYYSHLG